MGQHRGSGRGPHTIEHASHLDAADLAQAVAIRRDRLVARQLVPYAWSPSRADEIHVLGETHRDLTALVERRRAGAIPDGTPTELALAGAAPERIMRAIESNDYLQHVFTQTPAEPSDMLPLFSGIPHLTPEDMSALTTWASWEATVCTGQVLAAALVAVLHRAVQVSRMGAR